MFRYDEDYAFLRDPARRTEPLDGLKFVPLGQDPAWYLSIGGEARMRYEYFREPGFGLRGLDHDDFVLQRFLLHADVHTGEHVRGFVQFVSGLQAGNESEPSPTQDDALDLQQAFADLSTGEVGTGRWRLRAGRMEMSYGSSRLVTARDAPNIRLNFDGVRGTYAAGESTIDAFLTRPVQQKRGLFNDEANEDQAFWGVYAVTPLGGPLATKLDLYYLGLERAEARFASGVADETRHSIGARFSGTPGGWDYDVEAVFQFGSFGEDQIRAWTIASNIGYTFRGAAWTPRVGLKANIASGDQDPSDGTLGTFNAMFPRANYFNEANLIAPANFFDVHPSVQVSPLETVTLTAAVEGVFRQSTRDAVYSPGRIGIPATASDRRYVGTGLTLQADWTISRNASMTASYTHFARGPVVEDAGGEDVDFLGTWITFRF